MKKGRKMKEGRRKTEDERQKRKAGRKMNE
jgi:hypothetical protein